MLRPAFFSFPTPSELFQVWEMDLCGPFPLSSAGHSYIFTAIDMFSKFVYAEPIANFDSLTVCNVIYRLFTTFGVCRTILSDQGSEFIAKSTKELCKLMDVPQEFTPSFAHHCLGARERSHRENVSIYMTREILARCFACNCFFNELMCQFQHKLFTL